MTAFAQRGNEDTTVRDRYRSLFVEVIGVDIYDDPECAFDAALCKDPDPDGRIKPIYDGIQFVGGPARKPSSEAEHDRQQGSRFEREAAAAESLRRDGLVHEDDDRGDKKLISKAA
jgi:hypothetical protein